MTEANDHDKNLPETAEVGSEGGSYSDAVVQEATRKGELPRIERPTGSPATAGEESEATNVASDDPEDGVHSHRSNR